MHDSDVASSHIKSCTHEADQSAAHAYRQDYTPDSKFKVLAGPGNKIGTPVDRHKQKKKVRESYDQ